ncbi:MAG: substrate-binding domain-containing protein [Cytophagales bacterium]|nr:substrate-binding domain-containing protein [Cytophagales bacterium]
MRIGGVPEHFNLPWRLAIEEGVFANLGLDLQWTDYPGGTGALNRALRDGELDLAVILTEGMVADIINGNPARILKIHVRTPLNWGVFVNSASAFRSLDNLRAARFAVSRMGSGSHLMAYVNALQRGWDATALRMVVLQNLDGMRRGLRDGEADAFMWEKVMTQPHVDSGELRRVGVVPTPWPGFVLAARGEVLAGQSAQIAAMCKAFNAFVTGFKARPHLAETIARRYALPLFDVRQWLAETEWATDNRIDSFMLENVMDVLQKAGMIAKKIPVGQLMYL